MATTYAELKVEAGDYMTRASQAASKAANWIALAEAKLNRVIGAVQVNETLTGTTGSRSIDISSLSMVEPIALMLAEAGLAELELTQKANGAFTYRTYNSRPRYWSIDGTDIVMDCPLQTDYPFRFRYKQRFALSDVAQTNWLLTYHPDVYLAATMMWGAGYNEDWANGATWKGVLEEGIDEVKHQISQINRGVLTVDPAIQRVGIWRRTYSDLVNNG